MSEHHGDGERGGGPNTDDSNAWLSAGVVLLGIAMVLQALRFDLGAVEFWNDALVGALLIAVGGYDGYRRTVRGCGSVAASTLIALLGLWLATTSFVFGVDAGLAETVDTLPLWSSLFGGVFALVLGTDSAVQVHDRSRRSDARTRPSRTPSREPSVGRSHR
ncbi:MAG: hypothetical protein ABEH78_07200 [Haloferacaceae archaeon]